jgi:hypothetical protein
MNISNRLNSKVKFLRGNGFVVEQGFNEAARDAQMNSAFNCAFSNDEEYTAYAAEGVYLNDNEAFIEKHFHASCSDDVLHACTDSAWSI